MISTGHLILDRVIKGYDSFSVVYGQPGTGKTTLGMTAALALAKAKKKILYIDTEGGFNIERFQQLEGFDPSLLDRIVVLHITSFIDQEQKICSLITLGKRFDLIIIDTIGALYRQAYRNDIHGTNASMEKQMRILTEISRSVPVLLLNQVYSVLSEQHVQMVGERYIAQWCKQQILLQKEPRCLIQEKPTLQKALFRIESSGFVFETS